MGNNSGDKTKTLRNASSPKFLKTSTPSVLFPSKYFSCHYSLHFLVPCILYYRSVSGEIKSKLWHCQGALLGKLFFFFKWLFKVRIWSQYILRHLCWVLLNVGCCVHGIFKGTDIKWEENVLVHMLQVWSRCFREVQKQWFLIIHWLSPSHTQSAGTKFRVVYIQFHSSAWQSNMPICMAASLQPVGELT